MHIEEVDLKDERELEDVLKKNPEQIEKGLKLIANQVITPKGRIDLLCVDKEGVLTIVELKVEQDDDHLKQAINYYDWVFENMDWLRNTYSTFSISNENRPKIILIAKNFTDSVITSAKYFGEVFDIKLYVYKALKINNERFVICNEIALPTIHEIPEKPKTITDHLNYITDEEVRKVCNETIELIKGLAENIEVTPIKWGISFKYKGRNFAALYPRRESFVLQWKESEYWPYETNLKKIERVRELIEEKIKKAFELVGGKFSITKESECKTP
jgi:Holliday junction resolvase-like predicted endonuclease